MKTIRSALNTEVIPKHLSFLENILSNSKTGWIANTEGEFLFFTVKMLYST